MKIIVPMAGRGKRLRPHTLTDPKPLVSVGGKPIVERLISDVTKTCDEPIDEIAFIIGDFGKEVEDNLLKMAERLGTKGSIHYQEEALGTAHAILCAREALNDNLIIVFADMLIKTDFELDTSKDGIIWVQKVEDPRSYGVVQVNNEGVITDFVEKPEEFISDKAIIGIYYVKDGAALKKEIEWLIDNNIKDKGEFQLTNALENLKNKGVKFVPGEVDEWLDCGNKNAAVYANQRILTLTNDQDLIDESVKIEDGKIIEPCFIGENVEIKNAIVGPYVSVGANSKIENAVVTNSIIQNNTTIKNAVIDHSMIGNYVEYEGKQKELSIGDYTEVS